jgi:hypothetical protein
MMILPFMSQFVLTTEELLYSESPLLKSIKRVLSNSRFRSITINSVINSKFRCLVIHISQNVYTHSTKRLKRSRNLYNVLSFTHSPNTAILLLLKQIDS